MYQRGQADLDEFMDVLDGAHNYGHYIVARCPFHNDTRPSFFVYEDKYRCSSCGAFGNTSDLLAKIKPDHVIVTTQAAFQNPWTKWLKDHDLAFILNIAYKHRPSTYLISRGIYRIIQEKLGIGKLDNWITFPIWDSNHQIVGAVARAGEGNKSEAKYVIPKGQSPDLLYVPSWKRVASADKVYVTFGIIDAITLYMLGYASISTTAGKHISPQAFDSIRKTLVFLGDSGESIEAFKAFAGLLGWRGKAKIMKFPDGAKDINDMIWKCDLTNDQVREAINELG